MQCIIDPDDEAYLYKKSAWICLDNLKNYFKKMLPYFVLNFEALSPFCFRKIRHTKKLFHQYLWNKFRYCLNNSSCFPFRNQSYPCDIITLNSECIYIVCHNHFIILFSFFVHKTHHWFRNIIIHLYLVICESECAN